MDFPSVFSVKFSLIDKTDAGFRQERMEKTVASQPVAI